MSNFWRSQSRRETRSRPQFVVGIGFMPRPHLLFPTSPILFCQRFSAGPFFEDYSLNSAGGMNSVSSGAWLLPTSEIIWYRVIPFSYTAQLGTRRLPNRFIGPKV
jgi:hypothetical protein